MTDQAESLRRLVLKSTCRGSDVADEPAGQASRLHGTDGKLSRHSGLVIVTGSVPGVGVTSVAVQLALAWKRHGIDTTLIDAHADRPAVHTYCEATAYEDRSWQDVLEGRRTLREACVMGPCGLPIIAARTRTPKGQANDSRATAPTRNTVPSTAVLSQLVRFASNRRVIMDAGPAENLPGLVSAADHCLLVSTPDESRLTQTYTQVKSIASHRLRANLWLVCNAVDDDAAATQWESRLRVTCDRCLNLDLGLAGMLPLESRPVASVGLGQRRQHPSGYIMAIELIAGRLEARMASQQAVTLTDLANSDVN